MRLTYLGVAGCLGCLAMMILTDTTHMVFYIQEDGMDISVILALIQGAISFATGGGISRLLDAIPQWANWHPTFQGQPAPFIKSVVAFVIVGAVMLALATVYQLLPALFPKLPPDVQAILISFAAIIGAYVRNMGSALAQMKAQNRQLQLALMNSHGAYESADPIEQIPPDATPEQLREIHRNRFNRLGDEMAGRGPRGTHR